ncbi:hypothetical protein F-liban_7 [Faustovirus]|nr:hypothetical protein F-liban_7 [Faustovirus]
MLVNGILKSLKARGHVARVGRCALPIKHTVGNVGGNTLGLFNNPKCDTKLFNIAALAGAAKHAHNHDLNIYSSGYVVSFETYNTSMLRGFIHIWSTTFGDVDNDNDKDNDNDNDPRVAKIDRFVNAVMGNVEKLYGATSWLDIDTHGVVMRKKMGSIDTNHLLALDQGERCLQEIITMMQRYDKSLHSVDIYDPRENELVEIKLITN